MSNQDELAALAEAVVSRPVPADCQQIDRLLSALPLWSSFINTSPKAEQKQALELIRQISASPTEEQLLYLADIACGRYHRIRRDGDFSNMDWTRAKELYQAYAQRTDSPEAKVILENFEAFFQLCLKSVSRRQRRDDRAPYVDTPLSTSRDPDSEEWKK